MKISDRQILSNLRKNMFAQYISIYNDNSTKRKIVHKTWGNQVRQRKPIPVSWRLEKEWCKWRLRCVTPSVWVRYSWERNGEDSEQSQKFEGKIKKKNFKNCLWNAKHAFFMTDTSCQSVARVTRQNTTSQKFWKNLLSVFATRSLTREGVAS